MVLAMLAGLVVVAGIYELEEGETPLAAWKRKVAEAVQRYVEREGKVRGDAVNTNGRKGGSPDPAVTANGETSCPTPLYP